MYYYKSHLPSICGQWCRSLKSILVIYNWWQIVFQRSSPVAISFNSKVVPWVTHHNAEEATYVQDKHASEWVSRLKVDTKRTFTPVSSPRVTTNPVFLFSISTPANNADNMVDLGNCEFRVNAALVVIKVGGSLQRGLDEKLLIVNTNIVTTHINTTSNRSSCVDFLLHVFNTTDEAEFINMVQSVVSDGRAGLTRLSRPASLASWLARKAVNCLVWAATVNKGWYQLHKDHNYGSVRLIRDSLVLHCSK